MEPTALLRLLALPFALFAGSFATEARAQALKGPGLDACLAQPSALCLLELAEAERSAFQGESGEEEAFDRGRWSQQMAMTEVQTGLLSRASAHLAQVSQGELRDWIVDIDGKFQPLPAGLDAQGTVARALETNTSAALRTDETVSKSLDRRAEAAWLLLAFDQRGKADAVLRSVLNDLSGRLEAGDKEVIYAGSTLMQALIALGDPALIEQLSVLVTNVAAGSGEDAELFERERRRTLRDLRLAQIRSQMAKDPGSVSPQAGDDDYVMSKVALAWALSGDIKKTTELLRSAPIPSQELLFLVYGLLEHDKIETALALAGQGENAEERSRMLSDIKSYLVAKGRIDEAEALLDRITAPGDRAMLLLEMAQRRADAGKQESARELLSQALAVMAREEQPMSKLTLTFDVASVQASLGDSVSARQTIAKGMATMRRHDDEAAEDAVTDPMDQFAMAVRAATVLAELGDGEAALDPIARITPPDNREDKVYGTIVVARALVMRNRPELARALLLSSLRGSVAQTGIDHESWSGLFCDMAGAWFAATSANGGEGNRSTP